MLGRSWRSKRMEQDERGSSAQSRELAYLKAAFLAMEPAGRVISLARQSGGGSLTEEVQNFMMENCIKHITSKKCAANHRYSKNVLKKLISSAECCREEVLEDLYEIYSHYVFPLEKGFALKDDAKNLKSISFFSSSGIEDECSDPVNLVVTIQCSSNILEGDTGCSIWPSSLFLSELILSYPNLFRHKVCLELGAGVGLAGIILNKVEASKVILTDGDLSTLENMRANLQINLLESVNEVECKHLLWESVSEMEIMSYKADVVIGADIIYDPLSLPHLVRVFSLFLKPSSHSLTPHEDGIKLQQNQISEEEGSPRKSEPAVAYLAVVIRNQETFNCFLQLASGAHLLVLDLTEELQPSNLLPYMGSYDRAGVRLYKISYSPR